MATASGSGLDHGYTGYEVARGRRRADDRRAVGDRDRGGGLGGAAPPIRRGAGIVEVVKGAVVGVNPSVRVVREPFLELANRRNEGCDIGHAGHGPLQWRLDAL